MHKEAKEKEEDDDDESKEKQPYLKISQIYSQAQVTIFST